MWWPPEVAPARSKHVPGRDSFFDEPTHHATQKLEVLRRYALAWASILTKEAPGGMPVLNVVETHAGRGSYATGHPGSPLVTIRALSQVVEAASRPIRFAVHLVEIEESHVAALQAAIDAEPRSRSIDVAIYSGDARRFLPRILARIPEQQPSFFFVDPFGYQDLTFGQLLAILRNGPRHELMFTFMIQFLFRFLRDETKRHIHEDLLGPADDWIHLVSRKGAERDVINLFAGRIEREGRRALGSQPLTYIVEPDTEGRPRPYVLLHVS
jgi:three-Cys-motif partner protein